jgi:hypothetical protein
MQQDFLMQPKDDFLIPKPSGIASWQQQFAKDADVEAK